jgi:hypothetical protein
MMATNPVSSSRTKPRANGKAPTLTATAKRAARKPKTTDYVASFHPGPDRALPKEFAEACSELEGQLKLPVWLLVHNTYNREPLSQLFHPVRNAFYSCRSELAKCGGGALLIVDSPGGIASSAYEIARLFQRHCGSFTPVVPRFAKSAATLLVLGGEILMAEDAELGPLDAQVWDPEREDQLSALNEVQALERLHLQALDEIDQMVPLLANRTGKKYATVMPLVLDFVAAMKKPLLEKIDTVHYTQQARILKEAEDYAVRLLDHSGLYSDEDSRAIADRLVSKFPDHSFVIDREEADSFLRLKESGSGEVTDALSRLSDYLTDHKMIAIGRFDAKNSA